MLPNTFINAQGLKDYQWQNRIVLLVDEHPESKALSEQLEVLISDNEALEGRDLKIFLLTSSAVFASDFMKTTLHPRDVYQDYDIDSTFKGIILLGKDGGVKMREPFEVTTDKIFALIDGMPMRRTEIQQSKGN